MVGGNPFEGFFLGGSWSGLYQRIRFPLRPAALAFGRGYALEKTLHQSELELPFPPAPPRLVAVHFEKRYVYTISLEPCPNRGLDVKRC
jgi:hypothetical protein